MIRVLVIVGLVACGACGDSHSGSRKAESAEGKPAKATPTITIASRANALPGQACENCHRYVEGGRTFGIRAHNEIRVKHMPHAQCDTCHEPEMPARLRLASGRGVALEDLHELCGQCHSREARDWSVGIHGKQVGNWQTEIHRYSCTRCHDAHKPAFGPMKALPAPPFPKLGIPKGDH